MRKSKREKEKEAAEAKRKEEEENAAKAYAEFLHAFQGEEAERRKSGAAFVKAGKEAVYAPSSRSMGESSKTASMFAADSGVRSSCVCHVIYRVSDQHVASLSACCCAQTEGQACYGLVLGGNQEVRISVTCCSIG